MVSGVINHVAGAVSGALPAINNSQSASPFSGVFQGMVEKATDLESKAHTAVTDLLSGQGVEVHDAMIATQKADMAFELALQVRNKVVGAYQQMMQMQF